MSIRSKFFIGLLLSILMLPSAFAQQGFRFAPQQGPPPHFKYCFGKINTLGMFFAYREAGISLDDALVTANVSARVMKFMASTRDVPVLSLKDVEEIMAAAVKEVYAVEDANQPDVKTAWLVKQMDACVKENAPNKSRIQLRGNEKEA